MQAASVGMYHHDTSSNTGGVDFLHDTVIKDSRRRKHCCLCRNNTKSHSCRQVKACLNSQCGRAGKEAHICSRQYSSAEVFVHQCGALIEILLCVRLSAHWPSALPSCCPSQTRPGVCCPCDVSSRGDSINKFQNIRTQSQAVSGA